MSLEIAIIFVLILTNGVFAMSEIAVVSSRKARLAKRAHDGDAGAKVALDLAEHPGDFLSTVQVGISLIGIGAGAFGGATLTDALAARLAQVPAVARYAEPLALTVVVLAITYFSLILGELVPKRLALLGPERVASAVARPMRMLSVIAAPVVRVLSGSSSLVLKALGARASEEPPVTEEEIKLLLAQGTQAGAFEAREQEIVERVFRFADRRLGSLMTPRTRVVWLDVHDSPEEIRRTIADSPFSRFPVGDGQLENCLGFVRTRELLDRVLAGEALDLQACLRQPLLLPENARALDVLERFKASGTHLAMVIDEYGGIHGLVTLNDVLEAIVGDMPTVGEVDEAAAVRRQDGSWLVDGAIPIEELRELVAVPRLPAEEKGAYRTLAGFVMQQLGRVPRTGDRFEWGTFTFEVVDMDGHQVDKVLVAGGPPSGSTD
jgi:putative hemolysin